MKATLKNIEVLRTVVDNEPSRSAWKKGVKTYAHMLLDSLEDWSYLNEFTISEEAVLNGAPSWDEWSWGGCGLIYNYQIAELLCNPTELKKTKGGEKDPNPRESWLDVQARAARQAWWMIERAIQKIERKQDHGTTVGAEIRNGANIIYKDYSNTVEVQTEKAEIKKTA